MRDGSEHFVSESHSIFRLVYAKPFVKKHLTETDDLEKLYTSPVANAVVGYTPSQELDAMEPVSAINLDFFYVIILFIRQQ